MHTDTYGHGAETFVLLHGIPGWRGSWAAVASRLADTFTVIVPDLPGFGDSPAPASFMHADGYASAVLELMEGSDLRQIHLAGFDFGGAIAATVASTAPERVRSLGLVATNVFTGTPIPLPLKIAAIPGLGEAAFRLMMGKTGLSMMWRGAARNRTAFPFAAYREALREPGVTSTRTIFLQSLRHLRRLYGPIEAGLGRINAPATVIWGDHDPFFPLEVGRRTAAAIAGARFVRVADCGHFVPQEYPEIVARELRSLAARA